MIVFPAIDIIDGKCVRLTYGDYDQKVEYHDDPIDIAHQFAQAGFTHLHMVDLDGAKQGTLVNQEILEKSAQTTSLNIDFGGGIRSEVDAQTALDSGAVQINVGSLAVSDPEEVFKWMNRFGPEKIILSADIREGMIAVHGWKEKSDRELFKFVESYLQHGLKYLTCTDISKDGALTGAAIPLYINLVKTFPQLKVIASGGVHHIDNVFQVQDTGCYGVIIGKAIYEKKIKLEELVKINQYAG